MNLTVVLLTSGLVVIAILIAIMALSWSSSAPAPSPTSALTIPNIGATVEARVAQALAVQPRPKPQVITKEVPVEVIKEVVREVPVEVIKEVVREVPVEVIKEVVREVPVEVIKEVVREVPVEVIKEVVREVLVVPTPTPTPTATLKPVPTAVPTPTPAPLTVQIETAWTEENMSSGTYKCWAVTLTNLRNTSILGKNLFITKKDENNISWGVVDIGAPTIPANGKFEKRTCDRIQNPPIVNVEVDFVETERTHQWCQACFPGHIDNPDLWTELTVNSQMLTVTSQPTKIGEYYGGIPASNGYWNVINFSDRELYAEACMEQRWIDNSVVRGYSCSKTVLIPEEGYSFGHQTINAAHFQDEWTMQNFPTNRYHSHFMGIWFIDVEEAMQNGIAIDVWQ